LQRHVKNSSAVQTYSNSISDSPVANMSNKLSSALMLSSDPQTTRPAVSVVIVVWNAKKYVIECLESLRQHCHDFCDDVIIVDNASTDGTPELIAKMFPEFRLIRNLENLGFAKANNIGIAQCSGEYVCLVNSDVKFTGDCFSPMLKFLSENPGVGMVGPKMLGPDGRVFRSTMRFPTLWNQFCRAVGLDVAFKNSRLFGGYLMSDFDHLSTAPVEVLNGWFVLVRRSALDRVGPLDPQFFMYGEDVDWSYRFHQAGQTLVLFADAEAIHYGGASSSNAPLRFYLEQCYANLQYWRKHRGRLAQISFLANLAMHNAIRLLGAAFAYVVLPSERPHNLARLRRSLACLQWISHPERKPLGMTATPSASKIS
jgi:GT2 family glycosyltransferase